MAWTYTDQIITCAAVLLAAILIRLLPPSVRKALFILMFGTGVLAFAAGFADAFADKAVAAIFG